MILLMGASPAPSALSCMKAFGLTQQIAFGFEHAPLNSTDWPATILARRAIFEPFKPAACEAVAVRGAPVWKCMRPLRDHPLTTAPPKPFKLLPQGDSTMKLVATMCVASKLNLPSSNCFQDSTTPPVCVPPANAVVVPFTNTGLAAVLTRQVNAHSGSGFSL